MQSALKTSYDSSQDPKNAGEILSEGVSIGSQFAYRFGELIKLLRQEKSALFMDVDKNYTHEVFQLLDALAGMIQNKSLHKEAINFLRSFETLKPLKTEDITDFLHLLRSFEDSDEPAGLGETTKKFGKAELLRSLFLAFGVTDQESVGGVKRGSSNLFLNRYVSGLEGFPARLYVDHENIVHFSPTELDAQIFTNLKSETISENEAIVHDLLVPIIDTNVLISVVTEVQESVEEVVSSSKPLSVPQLAAMNRRRKQSAGNAQARADKELLAKKDLYDEDYERLHKLGSAIRTEFTRLQGYLLESIPYIAEVIDYLSYYTKLVKEGYIDEKTSMLDVPAQLHQYNESLNAHIVEMKQEKIQLEQKITSMLGAVHNDTSIDRKTSKSIDRKTARIKKLETRISEDDIESSEISVKEAEMGVIISRFRFTAGIPTQEEFKTGVFKSLRAEEFPVPLSPTDDKPVSYDWIEENIIEIFTSLVGVHFVQDDIDLKKLTQFLQDTENLNPEFSETTVLPTVEGLSQTKVSKFIDSLIRVIPKDFLTEVPIIRKNDEKKSEGNDVPEVKTAPSQKSSRRVKLTHVEVRNMKAANALKKHGLVAQMLALEPAFQAYRLYWIEKEQVTLKKLRKTNTDIEHLRQSVSLRSISNKGLNPQELDDLKDELTKTLGEIREKLQDPDLLTDKDDYVKLQNERSTLQAKIKRIH